MINKIVYLEKCVKVRPQYFWCNQADMQKMTNGADAYILICQAMIFVFGIERNFYTFLFIFSIFVAFCNLFKIHGKGTQKIYMFSIASSFNAQ